ANRVGGTWEERVIADLGSAGWTIHEAKDHSLARKRELAYWVEMCRPGERFLVSQASVSGNLGRWRVQDSRPDIVLVERNDGDRLNLLVMDFKAARSVELAARLQVAIYRRLIEERFPDATVHEGILYRPPVAPEESWTADQIAHRVAAEVRLGIASEALLALSDRPEQYRHLLDRMVAGDDSLANRIAAEDFANLAFHLNSKCDGCLFNQFCIRSVREMDNLSGVPLLSERHKRQLEAHGIATVSALASLDIANTAMDGELLTAPGLGHRLPELVARGRALKAWDAGAPLNAWLDGGSLSTLPAISPTRNANLVQVFLDLQRDPAEGRVAVLGALVRGVRNGDPGQAREREVVRVSPVPVDSEQCEAELVTNWMSELLLAIRDTVSPGGESGNEAPIHLYVWDSSSRALLADLVNRQHRSVLGIEAILELMTQRASFDGSNLSIVRDEIERQRALPILCQSLQSVAAWLGFRWPQDVVATFRTRQFDALERESTDERSLLVPSRARFRSELPGEYLHVAWQKALGLSPPDEPEPDEGGAWRFYERATLELVEEYQLQRLRALEHVTSTLRTNRAVEKRSFDLSALARLRRRPATAIEAVREFIAVERHVEFDEWRSVRSLPPDRRVLTGDSMLLRMYDADQEVGVRDELRRARDTYERRTKLSSDQLESLSKEQRKALDWSLDGLKLKLRMEATDLPVPIPTALLVTRIGKGDHVVVGPAFVRDEESDAQPRPSSATHLLYQHRGTIENVSPSGVVELTLRTTHGRPGGFIFSSSRRMPPKDGELLAIEPSPDSFPAYRQYEVAGHIARGRAHGGFNLLFGPKQDNLELPKCAPDAQARFFEGLNRYPDIDPSAPRYEASKREYIGENGSTRILLVQGPPGTGKSSTTGFAVLARMQAALAASVSLRVAVACKTHAATDVLLKAIRKAQIQLELIAGRHPDFFHDWFDERVLGIPLFRYDARPDGESLLGISRFEAVSTGGKLSEATRHAHVVVGATTNGLGKLAKEAWKDGDPPWDLLVLDESSQMSVPEYLVASIGLRQDGRLIVVGDHRQMPPIVRQHQDEEKIDPFDPHAIYRSLFDIIRHGDQLHTDVKFTESFRVHRDVAAYLRQQIYQQDGIQLFSSRTDVLASGQLGEFAGAVLGVASPVVLVVHSEASSQQRNSLERDLAVQIVLAANHMDAPPSMGVVVPHRAQRSDLRARILELTGREELARNVDTVERFQGDEKGLIIVSATESDPTYIRDAAGFLLDPRRLTVAISRATHKMVVIASESVFAYVPGTERSLADSEVWHRLRGDFCNRQIWAGEVDGHTVTVFVHQEGNGDDQFS
ncbi:MAG: ATP-binding protein, partial [Chloroflexota bacterium]|nr:ATP-binding protein [Chloroflexota bacterium]